MVAVNVVASNDQGCVSSHPKHAPELGTFIYLLAFMAVIGGFLFGYDTGIVSAAMLYVPKNADMTPMSNVWHEVIVSITPGMAGVGALFAGKLSDIYGRRKMIIFSTVVFTLGGAICAIGISKWILLIGRILLGIAIGLASMIVPIYVGESSPAHIRGSLISTFQMMICFGQVAANIFAGAFSYVDPVNVGWRLMFGFAALPSIIQFFGFCFLPESPRWLYRHRTSSECEQVLSKVYNGDKEWIAYELNEIQIRWRVSICFFVFGRGNVALRILLSPPVRKALLIGSAMQAFQQLSGINTIMYYTGAIIKSAGVQDDHNAIWISVGTASVIFLGTLVPIYLVERLGRRVLFLGSIFCVLIATLLMGGAFLLINNDSAPTLHSELEEVTLHFDQGVDDFQRCFQQKNCDFCTTDEACGFCAPGGAKIGYCLPKDPHHLDLRSTSGPCSLNSTDRWHTVANTTYEWNDAMCQTKFTVLPIILMVVFLLAFGAGYAPLPWVFNAEFYPLWARGTCVSFTTFCNWAFNLLVSLTFLSLSETVSRYGAFFIYASITAIALVLFYFIVPETKGLNLDEVQLLFMTKIERQRAVSVVRQRQTSMLRNELAEPKREEKDR